MKIFAFFLILFLGYSATAQKTEAYYDFYWQPCAAGTARFYGTLEKTDSGWLRKDYYLTVNQLQMQALYKDEACKINDGNCFYFHANGVPSMMGRYISGKKEGNFVRYYSNGMIADSAMFHNGLVVDKRFCWHRNGYLSDSISRVNDSVSTNVGWFDDGNLAYAGFFMNSKPDGKWKYYHHNGKLSAIEIYNRGDRIRAEYFDETGKAQTDTSAVNREAMIKGGERYWIKYLEKHLYWPANLEFTTSGAVTIGIDFAIDENGKVIDEEVSIPFHEKFDKIAYKIVKDSPEWLPAIAHNRKIKVYRRQPITFSQPE